MNVNSSELFKFETLTSCPACSSREASAVLNRPVQGLALKFQRCEQCGLTYQNPRLTREALANYFSSATFIQDDPTGNHLDELLGYPDYFAWDESYRATASLRLRRITKFIKPPADLLEIGSATGSFLDAARSYGFRVKGLDLSTTFADMARQRYALDIQIDSIEDCALPESYFDVICNFGGVACWRDPIRALTNIGKSLKSNGVFVLNHFDCDALPARILGYRHFEYHHASLIIYSKKTMAQCLGRAGFEIIFSESERQYASLGRITGYLKMQTVLHGLKTLRLENVTIPLVVPGTIFTICRKAEA